MTAFTVVYGSPFSVKWIIPAGSISLVESWLNLTTIDSNNTVTHYRDSEYTFNIVQATSSTDGYIETTTFTPPEGIFTVYLNIDNPDNNRKYEELDSISVYVATHPSGNIIETRLAGLYPDSYFGW